MLEELLDEAKAKMDQAIVHTQDEFATVRSGRANPSLLHRVTVDYYGTQTPLQQLAGFSVPEPRLLVVSPYDQSAIGDIERAIQKADLGLTPSN
ncbi:MAG: ribosome recycling factor, partial [Acidimicrobiia bacterium]|nr:ribosome recycling factor [Acidimicrobiia bacterium]